MASKKKKKKTVDDPNYIGRVKTKHFEEVYGRWGNLPTEAHANGPRLIFPCPFEGCSHVNRGVKKTGYGNARSHILSQHFRNDVKAFDSWFMCEKKKKEQKQQTSKQPNIIMTLMEAATSSVGVVTEEEEDMAAWVEWLILRLMPMSEVEDPTTRKFCNRKHKFGHKRVLNVLHKMSEMVESEISQNLKQASKVAIAHDGWSRFGHHYLGMMAYYIKTTQGTSSVSPMEEIKCDLLSVSVVSRLKPEKENEEDPDEIPSDEAVRATASNLKTHVQFVLETFYEFDMDWLVCLIADNTSVNHSLAELMGVPMISCALHKLNLEVKKLEREQDNFEGKHWGHCNGQQLTHTPAQT